MACQAYDIQGLWPMNIKMSSPLLRIECLFDSFPVSHAVEMSSEYHHHVRVGPLKVQEVVSGLPWGHPSVRVILEKI